MGHPYLPLLTRAVDAGAPARPIRWPVYIASIVILTAAAVGGSCWLLLETKPQMSKLLEEFAEFELFGSGRGREPSVMVALILVEVAFCEEVVFRLGIQAFLAKVLRSKGWGRYWVAIVLTSFLWTLGHVGVMDPNWVKIVQIFPLGVALGVLFRKYGLEACALVHVIFNVTLMYLSPMLITT